MKPKRILVVEDEAVVAADLEDRLRQLGYEPVGNTGQGDQALSLAKESAADLVLMDIQLQGALDGITAADQIRQVLDIPVVFLTAHADDFTFQRAKDTAPFGYVLKPFSQQSLQTAIGMALERHALEYRLKRTQQWLTAIIENVGCALVVTDEWGLVQSMNRQAAELCGWSPADAFLKSFGDVFALVDAFTLEPIHLPIGKTIVDSASAQSGGPLRVIGRTGVQATVYCSASPIRDAVGAVTGVVWLLPTAPGEGIDRAAGRCTEARTA